MVAIALAERRLVPEPVIRDGIRLFPRTAWRRRRGGTRAMKPA